MPRIASILWLLCLQAAAFAQVPAEPPAPAPDDPAFDRQLRAIVPAAGERAWLDVGWQPQFRTALLEADRRELPVLLWAMNGHPLGQC